MNSCSGGRGVGSISVRRSRDEGLNRRRGIRRRRIHYWERLDGRLGVCCWRVYHRESLNRRLRVRRRRVSHWRGFDGGLDLSRDIRHGPLPDFDTEGLRHCDGLGGDNICGGRRQRL